MIPVFCSPKFRGYIEVTKYWYDQLMPYILNHRKDRKRVVFQKVNDDHIDFFKGIMKNPKTKNLSINRKRRLLRDEFPDLEISTSTVAKVCSFIVNVKFLDLKKIIKVQL